MAPTFVPWFCCDVGRLRDITHPAHKRRTPWPEWASRRDREGIRDDALDRLQTVFPTARYLRNGLQQCLGIGVEWVIVQLVTLGEELRQYTPPPQYSLEFPLIVQFVSVGEEQ